MRDRAAHEHRGARALPLQLAAAAAAAALRGSTEAAGLLPVARPRERAPVEEDEPAEPLQVVGRRVGEALLGVAPLHAARRDAPPVAQRREPRVLLAPHDEVGEARGEVGAAAALRLERAAPAAPALARGGRRPVRRRLDAPPLALLLHAAPGAHRAHRRPVGAPPRQQRPHAVGVRGLGGAPRPAPPQLPPVVRRRRVAQQLLVRRERRVEPPDGEAARAAQRDRRRVREAAPLAAPRAVRAPRAEERVQQPRARAAAVLLERELVGVGAQQLAARLVRHGGVRAPRLHHAEAEREAVAAERAAQLRARRRRRRPVREHRLPRVPRRAAQQVLLPQPQRRVVRRERVPPPQPPDVVAVDVGEGELGHAAPHERVARPAAQRAAEQHLAPPQHRAEHAHLAAALPPRQECPARPGVAQREPRAQHHAVAPRLVAPPPEGRRHLLPQGARAHGGARGARVAPAEHEVAPPLPRHRHAALPQPAHVLALGREQLRHRAKAQVEQPVAQPRQRAAEPRQLGGAAHPRRVRLGGEQREGRLAQRLEPRAARRRVDPPHPAAAPARAAPARQRHRRAAVARREDGRRERPVAQRPPRERDGGAAVPQRGDARGARGALGAGEPPQPQKVALALPLRPDEVVAEDGGHRRRVAPRLQAAPQQRRPAARADGEAHHGAPARGAAPAAEDLEHQRALAVQVRRQDGELGVAHVQRGAAPPPQQPPRVPAPPPLERAPRRRRRLARRLGRFRPRAQRKVAVGAAVEPKPALARDAQRVGGVVAERAQLLALRAQRGAEGDALERRLGPRLEDGADRPPHQRRERLGDARREPRRVLPPPQPRAAPRLRERRRGAPRARAPPEVARPRREDEHQPRVDPHLRGAADAAAVLVARVAHRPPRVERPRHARRADAPQRRAQRSAARDGVDERVEGARHPEAPHPCGARLQRREGAVARRGGLARPRRPALREHALRHPHHDAPHQPPLPRRLAPARQQAPRLAQRKDAGKVPDARHGLAQARPRVERGAQLAARKGRRHLLHQRQRRAQRGDDLHPLLPLVDDPPVAPARRDAVHRREGVAPRLGHLAPAVEGARARAVEDVADGAAHPLPLVAFALVRAPPRAEVAARQPDDAEEARLLALLAPRVAPRDEAAQRGEDPGLQVARPDLLHPPHRAPLLARHLDEPPPRAKGQRRQPVLDAVDKRQQPAPHLARLGDGAAPAVPRQREQPVEEEGERAPQPRLRLERRLAAGAPPHDARRQREHAAVARDARADAPQERALRDEARPRVDDPLAEREPLVQKGDGDLAAPLLALLQPRGPRAKRARRRRVAHPHRHAAHQVAPAPHLVGELDPPPQRRARRHVQKVARAQRHDRRLARARLDVLEPRDEAARELPQLARAHQPQQPPLLRARHRHEGLEAREQVAGARQPELLDDVRAQPHRRRRRLPPAAVHDPQHAAAVRRDEQKGLAPVLGLGGRLAEPRAPRAAEVDAAPQLERRAQPLVRRDAVRGVAVEAAQRAAAALVDPLPQQRRHQPRRARLRPPDAPAAPHRAVEVVVARRPGALELEPPRREDGQREAQPPVRERAEQLPLVDVALPVREPVRAPVAAQPVARGERRARVRAAPQPGRPPAPAAQAAPAERRLPVRDGEEPPRDGALEGALLGRADGREAPPRAEGHGAPPEARVRRRLLAAHPPRVEAQRRAQLAGVRVRVRLARPRRRWSRRRGAAVAARVQPRLRRAAVGGGRAAGEAAAGAAGGAPVAVLVACRARHPAAALRECVLAAAGRWRRRHRGGRRHRGAAPALGVRAQRGDLVAPVGLRQQRQLQQQLVVARILDGHDAVAARAREGARRRRGVNMVWRLHSGRLASHGQAAACYGRGGCRCGVCGAGAHRCVAWASCGLLRAWWVQVWRVWRGRAPLQHDLVRAQHAQQVDRGGGVARLLAGGGRERDTQHLVEHAQLRLAGRRRRRRARRRHFRALAARRREGRGRERRRQGRGVAKGALQLSELDAAAGVGVKPVLRGGWDGLVGRGGARRVPSGV